jgi:hypothetical protein
MVDVAPVLYSRHHKVKKGGFFEATASSYLAVKYR